MRSLNRKSPSYVKAFFLAAICLTHTATSSEAGVEATNFRSPAFKFERYDVTSGALDDDSVRTVFVDSDGKVWVGTVTGLAVYDGNQWTKRGFRMAAPLTARAVVRLFGGSTSCGPWHIVEGPRGAIWLGGYFGVWRVQNGRYEEMNSSPEIAGMLAMAVDNREDLWVIQKACVYRFDGQTWSTVLCPYIGKPASREPPGLHSIAIGTNGNVWIGGTVYGHPKAPWEHEGAIWVVDQERKKRGEGPPMAPLFEFDGKRWRAFGPPHGLNVGSATPESDERGHLRVWTSPTEQYVRDGETWKSVKAPDVPVGKRWFLIRKRGRAELVFRDRERLIEVRPRDHQTGEVLDVGTEQLILLHTAEDGKRDCVWLGTSHGLYRIWVEQGH